MMIDWNEYQQQIGKTVVEFAKLSPDTIRGYRTLSDANSKTGKLDSKTRELISIAIGVTTHCDGCIVIHTDAALKAGASREEIAEALGVAVAMNAGAALVYSTRVLDRRREITDAARGLKLVPKVLIVDFVMMLNFRSFHEGAERARAAIRGNLL